VLFRNEEQAMRIKMIEQDWVEAVIGLGPIAQAVQWYKLAAEQGNTSALVILGAMFEFGQGIEEDLTEALKWYKLAAAKNNLDAQYQLAQIYRYRRNFSQDFAEAARWYKLAAEQGHADSQFNIGMMYWDGKGVLQDYLLAYMWLHLSAVNGNKNALEKCELIAHEMTIDQIETAQKMAENIRFKKSGA